MALSIFEAHIARGFMHNIASGARIKDKLVEYKIAGHYRHAGGLNLDAVLPIDLSAAEP